MWRTILMSAGLAMCILGGEAMVLDHVILADQTTEALVRRQRTAYSATGGYGANSVGYDLPYGSVGTGAGTYQQFSPPSYASAIPGLSSDRRTFVPPEWSPWGLLTAGVITFMYAANSMPGGRRTVVIEGDD